MNLKLSHTSVTSFTTCGRKYKLRYIDGYRPKLTSGALLFGSAIDSALNTLLLNKDLSEAKKLFDKSFRFSYINEVGTYLPDSTLVTYAKTDFDTDLLLPEDFAKFSEKQKEYNLFLDKSLDDTYALLVDKKESHGFNGLTDNEKKLLNLANWLCLNRKGHIILESYNKIVLPQIKNVLAVQKQVELENQEGDKIIGYIDLILEMQDGRRIVADNKTSSREYDSDSAQRSQQLILYYHITKEEYKLDGVGFIVMYKQILKNKTKICSKCSYNGSGSKHRTCPQEVEGKRCGGEWTETIRPEANIKIIINSVPEAAEDLVLSTFDEANHGIKNKSFAPNLSACKQGSLLCDYYSMCWKGDSSELVQKVKQ